jgi:hypothetical protein
MLKVKIDEKANYRRMISGIHCYAILRNPKYYNAFEYKSAQDRDHDKDKDVLNQDETYCDESELAQNNLVKLVLDLAYMNKT